VAVIKKFVNVEHKNRQRYAAERMHVPEMCKPKKDETQHRIAAVITCLLFQVFSLKFINIHMLLTQFFFQT